MDGARGPWTTIQGHGSCRSVRPRYGSGATDASCHEPLLALCCDMQGSHAEDDPTLDQQLQGDGQAEDVHEVERYGEDEHARDRPADATPATRERGAAQDHRGESVELEAL